jgi:hypothetical protein
LLQQYVLNTYVREDKFEWYLQKLHQKYEDYNTTEWSESTFKVKKLVILEAVEIKEIKTHKTQIEKDYSDSIWMILNLNVN